jgi:hypothetical protein
MKDASPLPQLPNAGFPWYQQLVMRMYVGPFVAGSSSVAESRKLFEKVNARILSLIDDVPPSLYTTRILVPPQPLLEDHSRYWSIAMTLEHLVTVGEDIKRFIPILARGENPRKGIDMKKIRPRGDLTPAQAVADFRRYVNTCMVDLEPIMKNANTKVTQKHPWFGEFNVHQWYWLLGTHSMLHLRQIKGILKGLPFEVE